MASKADDALNLFPENNFMEVMLIRLFSNINIQTDILESPFTVTLVHKQTANSWNNNSWVTNNSWCISFSHFCAPDDCFHFHAGGYIGCAFLPDHHNFQMLFVYKKTFWLRASGHSRFIRCCSGANFWFLWAGMSFFGTNRSAEKSTSSWLRGALACGH